MVPLPLLFCPLLVVEEAGPSCVHVLGRFPVLVLGYSEVLSWSGNLATSLEGTHYLDNAKPWLQIVGAGSKGCVDRDRLWFLVRSGAFFFSLAARDVADEMYGGLFSILWLLLLAIVLYVINLGPGVLVAAVEHQTFVHLVTLLGYLVEILLLFIQRFYLIRELVNEVILDKFVVWVHTRRD